MDTEDLTMEDKCENLMTIVVESRKRFGKMCVDYDIKTSVMENQILNLQLETISSYRVRSKNTLPDIEVNEMCKDIDDFAVEIIESRDRIANLRKRLKETESIVLQLKGDNIGRKVHLPITADILLKFAKQKMKPNQLK